MTAASHALVAANPSAPSPPNEPSAGWRSAPFSNATLRAEGIEIAGGGQWFRSLAIAPSDSDRMLWGTDVGGIFRSLDGGRTWEPCNVGYASRGASAMAFDPHNPDRVVAVGTNSGVHSANGIYLSTNSAASWREVFPIKQSANQDIGRTALAFDPSTFDPASKRTLVLYWSRLEKDVPLFGEPLTIGGGIMRSLDGGETWELVPGSEIASAAHLSVHPRTGSILAAGPHGVARSTDRGVTWQKVLPGEGTGATRSEAAPDRVWISQPKALFFSEDDGQTWTRMTPAGLPSGGPGALHNITAAPGDPNRLAIGHRAPNYQFNRYFSEDGGKTWEKATVRRDLNLVPSNAREGAFAFRSDNPMVILAAGGDYPALSRDGGKTYARAGSGVGNILVGSTFQFSAIDPNILALGLQDYGVLLTTDGGQNWRYVSPAGHSWGGFNYGAYTPDGQTVIVGDSTSWNSPKALMISSDGMNRWKKLAPTLEDKPFVSYGDPHEPRILFFGRFRSTDSGASWTPMEGATHVLGHDPSSGELIGIRRARLQGVSDFIVTSSDHGASWTDLFQSKGQVQDVAWNRAGNRIYFVENNRLRIWENGTFLPNPQLPQDRQGDLRVRSVAIDPGAPNNVYVAANRDIFASEIGALLSPDGGVTWNNLNLTEPIGPGRVDGGREAHWVRVHPGSGEAWFASSCYGVWIYRPKNR